MLCLTIVDIGGYGIVGACEMGSCFIDFLGAQQIRRPKGKLIWQFSQLFYMGNLPIQDGDSCYLAVHLRVGFRFAFYITTSEVVKITKICMVMLF